MGSDDWRLRSAVRNLLPRVASRQDEILAELRRAAAEANDPSTTGLRLAARFPELEGVAIALSAPAGGLDLAADEVGADARTRVGARAVVDFVAENPTIGAALATVFPQPYGTGPAPVLGILVADPLLAADGQVLRPGGRPRWALPHGALADRIAQVLRRDGRSVAVELEPATWERALVLAARADLLIVLCHGHEDGALAWEREADGREERVSPERFAALFTGRRPSAVAVLACHGEAAARAAEGAGVPTAFAIDQEDPLAWSDAMELAAGLVAGMIAGRPAAEAASAAARGTAVEDRVRVLGSGPSRRLLAPRGEPVLPTRDAWVDRSPRLSFVGREAELDELWRATRDAGVVAVIGHPGIGKTELTRALLARARLFRSPAAGSVFVDLEQARTATEIARAAIAVIGGGEGTGEPTVASAGRALGGAERLVVLDNAEDALEDKAGRRAFAELLEAIGAGRQARVVVTSRRKLARVAGVRTLQLSPLDAAVEGRELLRRELDASSGDAGRWTWGIVTADPALPALLETLDGHPLSLVLGAGHLADHVAPTRILQGLLAQGDLRLSGLDPGEAGRTEALGPCLALSLEALRTASPTAVDLWAIVAELPGGLPEGIELPAEDQHALDVLRQRNVLVRQEGGLRCLTPVKLFLESRLGPPDPALRRRVRGVAVAALAETLELPASLLGSRASNVGLAVFGRWLATIRHLFADPPWTEPGDAEARLLDHAAACALYAGMPELAWSWCEVLGPVPHLAGGAAELRRATVGEHAHHLEAARDAYLSLTGGRPAPARDIRAAALLGLGQLDLREDRLDDARVHLLEAAAAFHEIGNRVGSANAERTLGVLDLRQERVQEARKHFTSALTEFRDLRDWLGQANTLVDLGTLDLREARLDDARRRFDDALVLFLEIGDRLGGANTLERLGDLELRMARLGEARRRYEEALGAFREVGARLGEANTLRSLGELDLREHRTEDARGRFEEALSTFRSINERLGEANTLMNLGNLAVQQDRLDEARSRFDTALATVRGIGDRLGEAASLRGLATLAMAEGRAGDAARLAIEAAALSDAIGNRLGVLAAMGTAARAYAAAESWTEAVQAGMAARTIAREIGDRWGEALATLDLATALHHAGLEPLAGPVQLAAAVRGLPIGLQLPTPLESAARELVATGRAEELLDDVDAGLDRFAAWLAEAGTRGS